ncbi:MULTISPECIES: hypothetical protein [unclassified Spirosoma]|uniref:hypothetical protein n=1 Tax=unclassified Spirosoma TaxID=2621999 RepID=UPI0009610A6F|nr:MULTISPECIES: hypothetical protein [unclassified Spirosoma]MBN8823113.1 hypothetical protein [Spirosoma sp.]OJW73202.1 MAG: hypothetical protein BGO59_06880 [Spirosoma sp. 48-14]
MKTIRLSAGIVLLPLTLLTVQVASANDGTPVAKTTSVILVQDNAVLAHLDNAVASLTKGDKSATTQELQAGITGLESQAQAQPTSFKDKLLAQASKLKALLPLIPTGALGNGVLSKAVSLAKLASGGSQLEGILAAGSLLGKGSQLTSSLSGIGGALSALGGSTQSSGQSLVSTALATVGKLDQGGLVAKAAEPAAKTQVSSVLNFVKGVL